MSEKNHDKIANMLINISTIYLLSKYVDLVS